MRKPESSQYINDQRRAYSLYVMRMRAIPSITDGQKAGGRRVLWMARDGKKTKSATLAGATLPIHPHGAPEGAVNTLAAQYGNNIPLLKGESAFGTLLTPTEYSASRYTTVSASRFTQDVVYADIDIVPMQENYDGTLEEPVHFLPLVPVALLNPAEGIAVGFATNILPRGLDDLIVAQIAHLKGAKTISSPIPKFYPIKASAHAAEETPRGVAYYFNGVLDINDTSTATITQLPYGQPHEKVIAKLDALMETGTLADYTDGTKNYTSIKLKFKRGYLKGIEDDEDRLADLMNMLGLTVRHIENLNVLSFSGESVVNLTAPELIREFTSWRLEWYVKRYERLRDLLKIDIQRYLDIRTAIKNNVNTVAKKTKSRGELRDILAEFGIVYTDYIADLPIYRFTEEEYQKNEQRIKDAETLLDEYNSLLASETKRKAVYVSELQEVLKKFNNGAYSS